MADMENKLTVQREAPTTPAPWRPFDDLHREIDRLFDDFGRGSWLQSLRPSRRGLETTLRRELGWRAPVVDISETDKTFEISAEMPRYVRCRFIAPDDLLAGQWSEALAALLDQPPAPETMAANGAEIAADVLCEWLNV